MLITCWVSQENFLIYLQVLIKLFLKTLYVALRVICCDTCLLLLTARLLTYIHSFTRVQSTLKPLLAERMPTCANKNLLDWVSVGTRDGKALSRTMNTSYNLVYSMHLMRKWRLLYLSISVCSYLSQTVLT